MLGVYELSIKKISFETGLSKEIIEKCLKTFERVGKVKYLKNHIILLNFAKHQNYNTNMKKSAIEIYNNLPEYLKENSEHIDKEDVGKGFERVLKALGMVRKIEVEYEKEIEEEEEVKNSIEKRKQDFANALIPFVDVYGKGMIREFYDYWSETTLNNKKIKFELEKTFSLDRRLKRWSKNAVAFGTTLPKEKENEDKFAWDR